MKSITILLLHMQHGGIEKQTISMANELCKEYKVKIISTYTMKTDPAYPVDDRIEIEYLMDTRPNREEFKDALAKRNPFRILKEGVKSVSILRQKKVRMIRAIKKLDCDYVFSTRVEFAEMLSNHAPKGVVTITQEHLHDDSPAYVERVKRSFSNLDYLVVLSPGSGENYAKWLHDNEKIKLVEIPNFLETVPDASSALSGNRLIAAGRLHPVKNFDALIRVFQRIKKEIPDATLTILGDGTERKMLEDTAKKLGVEDKVFFKGMVSKEEIEKEMLSSDLYMMTSLTECFPMVLLEAQSCGLPLISFDVPVGPRQIIEEGVNGHLITDKDEEGMAKRAVALLKDRERLALFGKNAKEKSYQYTPEAIMPKWRELFGE